MRAKTVNRGGSIGSFIEYRRGVMEQQAARSGHLHRGYASCVKLYSAIIRVVDLAALRDCKRVPNLA